MHIIIPSRGRCGRVTSLDYIPAERLHQVTLVTAEARAYRRVYPNIHIVRYTGIPGLSHKRQWIHERFTDDPHVLMLDDDVKLFHRPDMASARLYPILGQPELQNALLDDLEDAMCEGFTWTGISARAGNNRTLTPYRDNTKSYGIWLINRNVVEREDIRYDHTEVMSDYQVLLNLLTRGYENRVFFNWAWDQASSSNAAGGCSAYRTPELMHREAHKLHDMFPKYVKVVQKKPKTGWFDGKPRTDVTIQWKKAHTDNEL